MKPLFRINGAVPFAGSAVRYLGTVHFESCTKIVLAAGFGLLVSFAACADSVTTNKYYQANNQAWSGSGYAEALWKLNGEGDLVSPSKGESGYFNEYISALGFGRNGLVRSHASGDNEFTGDGLVIGSLDLDGSFMLRYGSGRLTIDRLTLVRGIITSGAGGETLASSNPVVVRSTAASPFYFSIGNGRRITIDGQLYSEDDSAMLIVNRYSLEDKGESDNELKGGAIYLNGDNSAYKGKIKVDYLNYYNKGYTGAASNTNIVLNVNSNNALGGTPEVAMPDALTLANGGTLAVGYTTSSGAPFAPGDGLRGLTVTNGGRVSSSSALYFAMPVTSSDESTLFFDCPNQTVTLSATVDGSVSFDCSRAAKVVFASGFEWTSTGTLTLPDGTVVSKGESYTKMVAQISEMGWSSDGSTIYTNGSHWSGGTGVFDNGTLHFLDYGLQCRTPGGSPLSFPLSEKLTIVNGTFTLKSANYTIDNLALCSGAKFDCANDNWTCSVAGAIEISTSSSSPAKFMVDGTCNLTANLSGAGKVLFSQREGTNAKHPAVFKLGGNNDAFLGMIEIGSTTSVEISDGNQLGGNPSALQENGLVLTDGSTIEFTAGTLTLVEQNNRGLSIEGDGTVENSAEVVWFGPVSFSEGATLTKKGDGQLVFFASCSAGTIRLSDIGSKVKFKTVYADSVKVESGLPGYRVVVKSEASEYGADFRVYGLEKIRGLSLLVY